MTTSRTASGSSKTVQEFHLDVYMRCPPMPITKGLQPPWDRREDPNMYAVVTTVTPLGSPNPRKISVRVIKKNSGIDADEELDHLHLHDHPADAKKGRPPPMSARSQDLSVQFRWRVLKTNSTDPDMYRRAQMNFLDSKTLEACLALMKPLLVLKLLDPPGPQAASSTSSMSAISGSTSTVGVSAARTTPSSSAALLSLPRSQTAFQPSRAQDGASSSSSLFGPSASRPVIRKDSSKRKKLAQVDEDSEMVDAERPSAETQGSVPKKKQRSNPSPDKITGPAKSVARPSSSSQTRPAVPSTNRTASAAPAALATTNRKSSSSVSSSPGSSGSPTPAQIKKAARRPNPFNKANWRAPSTTTGPAGPELTPRTPISTQPDHPRPAHTSSSTASDLLTLQLSMPHNRPPPSSYSGMRPMAAVHAPLPVFAPASVPIAVAQSVFEDFASLSFVPPVISTDKVAVSSTIPSFPMDTSSLMDAPVSPYVSPPASSRSVSGAAAAAAAAAAPAVGMLVTIEEVTEGSEVGGCASASGKAVDPRERGGDGVRVEEMTNEDEMELDDLDDDALRKAVNEVMLEAGFSDLVTRIERMMPISEEE